MHRVTLLLGLLGIAAGASCQTEVLRLKHAGAPKIPLPEAEPPPPPIRAATFNAGLAVGLIPRAAERAPEVARAIASADVDLACVQEVWLDEHWTLLREHTSAVLPHAVRPPNRSEGDTKPCSAAELAPVARCALQHCWSAGSAKAAECALQHCGALAKGLAPECVGCLSRHPLKRVGDILDECVDPNLVRTDSSKRGALQFFDGSYGIGLLSELPLSKTDRLELSSAHHPRAVLYARLERGSEPLHVFCTHLTPILRGVPHPAGGSWKDEQSAQVDALIDFVDEKAADEPALILGDLNTGPAIAGARARVAEHYARFVRAGFVNPYLDREAPECTFCYADGRGLIIDHVLVRGFAGTSSAERFLDDAEPPLSDHYGVLVELRDR